MKDALIFVGLMVAVVLLYIAWKLRGRSWREYFSTRDGKGILKGIIIAPGAILLIALPLSLVPSCAKAGTWFNDASVYAGLDWTKKLSPQCRPNSVDQVRGKPRPSGRGRIARTAAPSYNGVAADNQGSLRRGMPEVTPVELRVAVAHSAQEPTEATHSGSMPG